LREVLQHVLSVRSGLLTCCKRIWFKRMACCSHYVIWQFEL